jgi:hypothetical protein
MKVHWRDYGANFNSKINLLLKVEIREEASVSFGRRK